jgi:NTF2 fold immunity protein
MKKIVIIFFVLIFGCSENSQKKSAIGLKNGFVPDSTSAKKIAEIIFINVYGEEVLSKKPFIATLKNGIWVVEGSLEKDAMGGVPRIEITQDSCKILNISHGK